MRNPLGIALVALSALVLSLGLAGSAGAATVSYTGSLAFQLATLPGATASGSGVYTGDTHISTISFSAGQFGPISEALPVTSGGGTVASVRLTGIGNLDGVMTGISGSPPGGGPMGLQGTSKICLFSSACISSVIVPLTPSGGAGLGVGGTQFVPGAVSLTLKHAPWTIGAPPNPGGGVFTIHTPNSNNTTPDLPVGTANPASSTANSGVLQLVTVSKVYTSLTGAFPELPVIAILNLQFAPEPGNLLLLLSGAGGVMLAGGLRGRRSARRKALLALLALVALGIVALLATSALAGPSGPTPTAGPTGTPSPTPVATPTPAATPTPGPTPPPGAAGTVAMCRIRKHGAQETVLVKNAKVAARLAKGLTLGECEFPANGQVMCTIDKKGNLKNIIVREFKITRRQGMGDMLGECMAAAPMGVE